MKAAIISLQSVSSKWVYEAMAKYFDKVDDINLKEVEINLGDKPRVIQWKGEPLETYDCMYVKGSFRYNALLRSIAALLDLNRTFAPIRPDAYTIAHDKLLTQLRLEKSNVPMPKTYVSSTPQASKKILEIVNYPIIMKFPEGTQGKGVMFADSFAAASSMIDALTVLKQPFIIQEYIDTGGVDIRAIVIGDKVVAAMKRKSQEGDTRANIHAGGLGETFEMNSIQKKIAIQASQALGAQICAVDMLESARGPVVLEVNVSPGLQGITKTTKIDVADKIAKFLYNKTKDLKQTGKISETKKVFAETGIEGAAPSQEFFTNLDLRGTRILLPEIVTNLTKFSEKDEVSIIAEKGKLTIKEQ